MLTLRELRKVKTIEDLENLDIGRLYYDIGPRGGGLGFYARDVACAFDVEEYLLPCKFGAGCNYLGGGIRSSVFASDFSDEVTGKRKRQLLHALAEACVRVYLNEEEELGLNEDYWNAQATEHCRKQGIVSAY